MSLHINTPRVSVFDPRGLLVRTVDYCRAIEDGPVAPGSTASFMIRRGMRLNSGIRGFGCRRSATR